MNSYDNILEGMRNIYSAKLVNMELEGRHDEVSYCLSFIEKLDNKYHWRKNNIRGYELFYNYKDIGNDVENIMFGIAHSHGFDIKISEQTYKMTKNGEKEILTTSIKVYKVIRDNIPYDWEYTYKEMGKI